MLQQNYYRHSSLPFTPKQTRSNLHTPSNSCHQNDLVNTTDQPYANEIKQRKNTKKHTEDEGFAHQQEQQQQVVIVKKQQTLNLTVSSPSKKFVPYRIKEPKIKLTFLSRQPKKQQPLSATMKRQYNNKSLEMKKTTHSKPLIANPENLINSCIIKLKRNFIGDNLAYQHYGHEEVKKIKAEILEKGHKVVYQIGKELSTYAYLSLIKSRSHLKLSKGNQLLFNSQQKSKKSQKDQKLTTTYGFSKFFPNHEQKFFLDFSINQLLKTKHKDSFIYHKRRDTNKYHNQDIHFDAEFESANLQIVTKVPSHQSSSNNNFHEYNLHLRNDTNTYGHQNWFYFRVKNNSEQKKRVKFNIVNLKRNLNLVKDGQRIYLRTISPATSQWMIGGDNVQVKENKTTQVYRTKVRMLSFEIDLLPQTEYEVSLLPPYTYSQMLRDIECVKDCKYAKIDTLTYSLVGMAIPIITFTNFQVQDTHKQVILISSRIHPGQTVASYITQGLIQALTKLEPTDKQSDDFLSSTIIKIIPMINPDGVVFGNFRTNYLGYDLNRSFHTDDEVTNPEIMALKQLGKKLKKQHGDKFTTFIDLHGHSSQKNIFTYGPDFENGNQKFYQARLLPKVLNSKSPYFKYNSCTFKLEEYKINTARGFFLNTLNVTAFTIESSYAVYENQDAKIELLTPKEWTSFGKSLLQSFELVNRLNKTHSIKNRAQLKRAISLTEEENYRLLNTLKKQMKKQEKMKKLKKTEKIIQNGKEDSDGQDEVQDLNPIQRDEMQKKLVQNTTRNYILPKVFKPSILYPTVTPKLFNIGQTDISNYKILYTRRNRYQSIRMPASNYLHSLQGAQSLKLKSRNIKFEKKIQFL